MATHDHGATPAALARESRHPAGNAGRRGQPGTDASADGWQAQGRRRQLQALDAHAIVSVTDAAGTITYVNDRFCQISGYERDELLGRNHRLLKSGHHDAGFYEALWNEISAGRTWSGVLCNRRKDGGLYWVEATIMPFVDDHGLPYEYVSVRTEVTALKRAEKRARESEERYQRSQSYANIGTWDWNIQTGELYGSETIGPLFGHPRGELDTTYENFLNAVHPEDRGRARSGSNCHWRRSLAAGGQVLDARHCRVQLRGPHRERRVGEIVTAVSRSESRAAGDAPR